MSGVIDQSFLSLLRRYKVSSATCDVLQEEQILSLETFTSLEEEHFSLLAKKLRVGQHAILRRLWHHKKPFSCSDQGTDPLPLGSPSSLSSSSSGRWQRSLSPASINPPSDDSLQESIKELADMYKQRQARSVSNENKGKRTMGMGDPRKMTVILGGMLYDQKSGKGVKRQCIPGPNPQKIELSKKSTLSDIFTSAKELYFGDNADVQKMSLADSSGVIVQIDEQQWILEAYYRDHDYKPSRHKLYVAYDSEADVPEEAEIFGDEDEAGAGNLHQEIIVTNVEHRDKNDEVYKNGYTLPRIRPCLKCGQKYRTYVPNTDCLLPNGNIVYYTEGQDLCPECDNLTDLFMNEDLFPHLVNN